MKIIIFYLQKNKCFNYFIYLILLKMKTKISKHSSEKQMLHVIMVRNIFDFEFE